MLADPAVFTPPHWDLYFVPPKPALSTWDQAMNGTQVEGTG